MKLSLALLPIAVVLLAGSSSALVPPTLPTADGNPVRQVRLVGSREASGLGTLKLYESYDAGQLFCLATSLGPGSWRLQDRGQDVTLQPHPIGDCARVGNDAKKKAAFQLLQSGKFRPREFSIIGE
ncbi:uncharacterized protein PSFLO_06344 [Pseudozyma flocculosa]|uniref:Uncharacterized protein n=1 Tax=Pseudozyma flocculosa TaxID=84751 RepID=A0A5C3F8X7_9BASI|nr:uncharacterized protein PSFLO_06344 [Pseudozyma flocculosa]